MGTPKNLNGTTGILFHYRYGKRMDGVSVVQAQWKRILESLGAHVLVCAGPESSGANLVVDSFEQQLNPRVFRLDNEAFGGLRTMTEKLFLDEFWKIEWELEQAFLRILVQELPDFAVVSNVFSVGEHLAAAMALRLAINAYHKANGQVPRKLDTKSSS